MSLALQTAEMEKVLCIRFAEIIGYAYLINEMLLKILFQRKTAIAITMVAASLKHKGY